MAKHIALKIRLNVLRPTSEVLKCVFTLQVLSFSPVLPLVSTFRCQLRHLNGC